MKYLLLLIAVSFTLSSCVTPYNRNENKISKIPEKKGESEPNIRILLTALKNGSQTEIKFKGNLILTAPEADYILSSQDGGLTVKAAGNEIILLSGKRSLKFSGKNKLLLKPENKKKIYLLLKDKKYAGYLELTFEEGNLDIINIIPLETYLAGVVPNEIPTQNRSAYEAVKAQAVAARTYALKRMQRRKNTLFHVYADHRDQVYNGIMNQSQLAADAVRETGGEILTYNEKPIDAVFHSTSGGILEDYASVWGDTSRPYLPMKFDYADGEILCTRSPYYHWKYVFNGADIEKRIYEWLGLKMPDRSSGFYYKTRDVRVKILDRTPGKRVKQIWIGSGDYELYLSGSKMRQFFRSNKGRMLPSTLVSLSADSSSLIIDGAGFGHGVGMSQYSAIRLAEKGYKYDKILAFFYPGTRLNKLY
jgi:stage II sporulation protein D